MPITFTLPDVRELLHTLLGFAMSVFGAPAALMTKGVWPAKDRKDFLVWLHAIERVARRYIIWTAAQLNAAPTAQAGAKRSSKPARRGPALEACRDESDSEKWRVSFAMVPRESFYVIYFNRDKREPSPPHIGWTSTARLAMRLEAATRVFDNPELYAKRFLARLRANLTCIKRMLGLPPKARPDPVGAQQWAALQAGTLDQLELIEPG